MEKWRGRYPMERFGFEGRDAVIVFPERPDVKMRWVLKTEYFYAFQDLEEKLVEHGFHLAYLKNNNRWGTQDDLAAKRRFAAMLHEKNGLYEKCVPVGMSCGGLHAIKQAALFPEMVSLLYLDAPVVNLLSCPFGLGSLGTSIAESAKQEALDALGLDMSGMIAYRDHPLDRLSRLTDSRIPALLVWGEADTVVPFEENGRHVCSAYAKTDIPFMAQSKPGCDHHPHGPADMAAAVDFILEYA